MGIKPIEHWRTLDEKGDVMPWYTRGACQWLLDYGVNGKEVFEYGCGQSTIWYRNNGAFVYGVDNNPEWANGAFVTDDKEEYINSPSPYKYDLIIIDGMYRDDCTEIALQCLHKGGYLIADNWDQEDFEWTKTKELTKHLPFQLFKEPEHKDWHTIIWQNI